MTPASIKVAALLGPTASGKSRIALRLASDLGMEILSCDSRQIYRCMDIGTDKPSPAEQQRVRHWLVDIVDPSEAYSAFRFREDAVRIIRQRAAAGVRILVCGGTGLYFKSLSEGLTSHRPSDPLERARLQERLAREGVESIFETLKVVDPASASRIHPRDTVRLVRALEVFYTTGIPLSEANRCSDPPEGIVFSAVVLRIPRLELYERINERVGRMARDGLWQEFVRLRECGFHAGSPGLQSPGYRELFEVEQGIIGMEEAWDRIRHATRRLAKRQVTWFRHQVHCEHDEMDCGDYDAIKARITSFLAR